MRPFSEQDSTMRIIVATTTVPLHVSHPESQGSHLWMFWKTEQRADRFTWNKSICWLIEVSATDSILDLLGQVVINHLWWLGKQELIPSLPPPPAPQNLSCSLNDYNVCRCILAIYIYIYYLSVALLGCVMTDDVRKANARMKSDAVWLSLWHFHFMMPACMWDAMQCTLFSACTEASSDSKFPLKLDIKRGYTVRWTGHKIPPANSISFVPWGFCWTNLLLLQFSSIC